mmetsp:Transcript_63375/g.151248  ORF Transcript_63375/g.151248 Transcript_63375/m.151248 type:complete len:373 (-) Transcript_63375:80-1198(-)|eukprot:CAMPEP_0178409566 /NCGR_PEP_ID=MMETSP0689_2-20121128/20529_1 /TAXON_ID=160604 /ORGANISM="Amphidinium massartii, Strain CS-259" /LENGTH=372 /DNA_ID=CAMNT_0020030713 /DNA_START=101 /DNA_END=1219 /DNA_ORIENTATION=+
MRNSACGMFRELILLGVALSTSSGVSLRSTASQESSSRQSASEYSSLDEAAVLRMWNGLDAQPEKRGLELMNVSTEVVTSRQGTSEAEAEAEATSTEGLQTNAEENLGGRVPYILLGPEDSGTNLLEHMIEVNWPGKFVSTNRADLLWKHSLWSEEIYSLLGKEFRNVKKFPAIATIRSPIAQVASWRKAPYDLNMCVNRPLEKLAKPCLADLGARPIGYRGWLASKFYRRQELKRFNSSMDVYNEYVRQYKKMAREKHFKSFTLIHYEDMVFTPDKIVADLAKALGMPAPQTIQLVDAPAKKVGAPVGREDALEKLTSRSYMEDMGQLGLKTLCPLVDRKQIRGMVEGKYLPVDEQTSYLSDCEPVLVTAK